MRKEKSNFKDLSVTLDPSKWKENIPLYRSMHRVVRINFKLKKICSFCDTTDSKRYERALIKGRFYSYNVEDYIELCTPCHRKYDVTDDYRKSCSERKKGKAGDNFIKARNEYLKKRGSERSDSKKISQFTLDGYHIKDFGSITEAALQYNRCNSSFSQCLKGKSNSCAGYKWKYKDEK